MLTLNLALINNAGYQDEVTIFYDIGQASDESLFFSLVAEAKYPSFFSDFPLVKNDDVVAELVKLQLLQCRNDAIDVIVFIKDAKR